MKHFREWRVHTRFKGVSCSDDGQDYEECASPVLPACVDRTPYCEEPPGLPEGAILENVTRPAPGEEWMTVAGTVLKYSCPKANWSFDYALPDPFISYYYSNNIEEIQIECLRSKLV